MGRLRALNLLSVVVPAYNEADNLPVLYARLADVLTAMGCDWELLVVDDGSTDATPEVLQSLHAQDSRVHGLVLTRNFGHEAACTAGLDAAWGDVVILMDADLQDPPELIPDLVKPWREGFDIVAGQRTSREGDPLLKRFLAFAFYRVMNRLVRFEFPRDIGNFRLMDQQVVDALRRCPERNRFVRGLTAWSGFRTTIVPFARNARHAGSTKYSARKVAGLALTSITGYSNDPLRIASAIGLFLMGCSALVALALGLWMVFREAIPLEAWILVSVWFLGGLLCTLLGLMGEYIGRIYTEARQRPVYFIQELIGTARPRDRS